MSEEFVEVNGKFYPNRIFRIAISFMEEMNEEGYSITMTEAIAKTIEFDEGLKNAKPADPNEPVHAIIYMSQKEEDDDTQII